MSIKNDNIPTIKEVISMIEEDPIVVEIDGSMFVLNDSAKEVWQRINGVDSVENIIEKLYCDYKEEYDKKYIQAVVTKAIKIFESRNFIMFK